MRNAKSRFEKKFRKDVKITTITPKNFTKVSGSFFNGVKDSFTAKKHSDEQSQKQGVLNSAHDYFFKLKDLTVKMTVKFYGPERGQEVKANLDKSMRTFSEIINYEYVESHQREDSETDLSDAFMALIGTYGGLTQEEFNNIYMETMQRIIFD